MKSFLPWCLALPTVAFRPPCVPLDVASPYQSTWSWALAQLVDLQNGAVWFSLRKTNNIGYTMLHYAALCCTMLHQCTILVTQMAPKWCFKPQVLQVMTTWPMELRSTGQAGSLCIRFFLRWTVFQHLRTSEHRNLKHFKIFQDTSRYIKIYQDISRYYIKILFQDIISRYYFKILFQEPTKSQFLEVTAWTGSVFCGLAPASIAGWAKRSWICQRPGRPRWRSDPAPRGTLFRRTRTKEINQKNG